jgi:hypothetical protein
VVQWRIAIEEVSVLFAVLEVFEAFARVLAAVLAVAALDDFFLPFDGVPNLAPPFIRKPPSRSWF